MSRGHRAITLVCALLTSLIVSAADLADLGAGVAAMACCAKTDYACAGMRAPDDCCRSMHHAASAAQAAITKTHPPAVPLLAIVTRHRDIRSRPASTADRVDRFTRPHDPPHLHTFALLI